MGYTAIKSAYLGSYLVTRTGKIQPQISLAADNKPWVLETLKTPFLKHRKNLFTVSLENQIFFNRSFLTSEVKYHFQNYIEKS